MENKKELHVKKGESNLKLFAGPSEIILGEEGLINMCQGYFNSIFSVGKAPVIESIKTEKISINGSMITRYILSVR